MQPNGNHLFILKLQSYLGPGTAERRQIRATNQASCGKKNPGYCSERDDSDEILVVTDIFNTEYPRVGGNSNKISSDGAFVMRDVRSIELGTVHSKKHGMEEIVWW